MRGTDGGPRSLTGPTPAISSRSGWIVLAGAMVLASILLLWLNRGSTFYFDELTWFADLGDQDGLLSIVHPHNNHLIGTARALFLLLAQTVGPEYAVVRVAALIGVLLVSGLLYVYARRRVGALLALLPAILVLGYGSGWQHVVGPIGLTITYSIAAGLGALLMLDRQDRRGDVLVCVLLCASIFTYSVGLSYLVGVAVAVLIRSDRMKRAWIFLVPSLLYLPWHLWARQFGDSRVAIEKLLDAPEFLANSFANVAGALSGVAVPFSRFGEMAAISQAPGGPLGWVVAAGLLAAIAWRISRGGVPSSLWASIAIVGSYWLIAAAADTTVTEGSQVDSVRYMLPGSIALLLVLIDALRGCTVNRIAAVALFAAFVFALAMNLVFLRDGAQFIRDHGGNTLVSLSMIELANGIEPGSPAPGDPQAIERELPHATVRVPALAFGPDPEPYIRAVEKFGSPAISLDEVRSQPASFRDVADGALVTLYGLHLAAADSTPRRRTCLIQRGGEGAFELPDGGALVRQRGAEPVPLSIGRFGDPPSVPVGVVPPDAWSLLAIPSDPAPDPWMGIVPEGTSIEVCPLDSSTNTPDPG